VIGGCTGNIKNHRYSRKLTEAIYAATADYTREIGQRPVKRRGSVSAVPKSLGVSRAGYHVWRNRIPSYTSQRRIQIKGKIQEILYELHTIYGAPKITKELHKPGETVAEKTMGNYMREMGLRAH